jgi:hypothetical protein
MATRGQTHQKRAREVARRERRELKQQKKAMRASGELPMPDGSEDGAENDLENDLENDAENGVENDAENDVEKEPADAEPETDSGWIQ